MGSFFIADRMHEGAVLDHEGFWAGLTYLTIYAIIIVSKGKGN